MIKTENNINWSNCYLEVDQLGISIDALEHEYKLPTIQQTFEFVEIAELFINATSQKLGLDFMSSFTINNNINQEHYQMYFDLYDISNGKITIYSIIDEKRITKILTTTDNEYLDLVSSVIKREYSRIPKILGYEIDEKYIKIEVNM
nr:hypothetical protein [uncultured Clostridium sp.]